ncbi:MAG TPA: N-acetylmuramoyl-L-alanine amidase [Trueperaceae bacterium]|nr:N-acetylmuramoyl-L-alanine amidase [Trueperaceae bacterium]
MRRPSPRPRAAARRWSLLAALLLALAVGTAAGQTALVVNGVTVDGSTTSLVKGTSYAPAAALASALGARYFTDADTTVATLQLGGHVLEAVIATDPSKASAAGALRLDGTAIGGPAGVMQDGDVYLPVKQVAEALGGHVAYLQQQKTVVVVQPRAQLTGLTAQGSGSSQQLVLQLSAPVGFSRFYNQPVTTLQLHFDRTDLQGGLSGVQGDSFVRADASSSGDGVDVRVQLAPHTDYRLYSLPDGNGFRVVVSFTPASAAQQTAPHIVIDPGHGGQDPGINFPGYGSEASLTLAFSQQLQKILEGRGFQVTLTRTGDYSVDAATRSRDGIGADLFVSIHGSVLPPGQFNAYYLSDASSVGSLSMAIRQNAQSAVQGQDVSALRRKILLGLVPQLDVGRSFADGLGTQLFQNGGYRASDTGGAPLYVLGGAAGRGVMLEFSPQDLASDTLAAALAGALANLLASGGATQ